MKRYLAVFIALFVWMLGCTLESRYGLPNDEPVTAEILGTWKGADDDDKVRIETLSEKQYRLILQDTIILNAYIKTIKNRHILDIFVRENEEEMHMFYGLEMYGDSLKFWEVNDKLNQEDFESAKALHSFFKANIEREDFLKEGTVLYREVE